MRYSFKEILAIIKEIRTFEKRCITMTGREEERYLYTFFTKRHPTYKIIPNKSIGVALIDLPESFEAFLKGSHMNDLRNKRNRATKTGHSFRAIEALDHLEEILEINRSTDVRDGRKMPGDYMDEKTVEEYLRRNTGFFGVFDKDGRLRSYIHVMFLGEVCVICRLLGHKDCLKDGIMYLMIAELVKFLIDAYRDTRYLMFDTVLGGNPGVRYFKDHTGFKPYRVTWRWQTVTAKAGSLVQAV